MLLTAEQLQEIRKIIADRHNAFVVNVFGPEAVAPDVLAALRAQGLLDIQTESLKDAYIYGKVAAFLGEARTQKMDYPAFRAYLKTNPMPLNAAERHAVQVASAQGGALCQGLGNVIDKATGALLIEADAELRRQTQATIATQTAENIARRGTIGNLRSELGRATQDWTRNLNRIAVTETQNAMQQGFAEATRQAQGPEARVSKRVAPGCCFAPGTLITTKNGLLPVEDIRVGSEVLTHAMRWRRVTRLYGRKHRGLLYGPNNRPQATGEHPYLLDGQWKRIDAAEPTQNVIRVSRRAHPQNEPTTRAQITVPFEIPVTLLTGSVPIAAVELQRHFLRREPKIDVVASDGHFWDRVILRQFRQNLFGFLGHVAQGTLLLLGNLREGLFGAGQMAHQVCLFGARFPLLGAEGFGLVNMDLPDAFQLDAGFNQARPNMAVRHAELARDGGGVGAGGGIRLDQHSIGDAAAFDVTHETCITCIGPIAQRFYEGPVFNFEVEEDNSYVADGAVVHNCDACVRLYTGPDGKPRIFVLSQLQANGTNQGRKAADWRPTVGPVHPNCIPAYNRVSTATGRVDIQFIKPGDWVWTHKGRLRPVTHVWCQSYTGPLVCLESGWRGLKATPNHPLYDGKGFRPAGEFVVGDTLAEEAMPHSAEAIDTPAGAPFEAYARVAFGQGPEAPFLALLTAEGVFMHEGFVYARGAIDKGPVVPALAGRLRYARGAAPSIHGGDALVLRLAKWVDDEGQPLVFRRVGRQMAQQLRLRCVPGPYASFSKHWEEPIAADPEALGHSGQGQRQVKMQAKHQSDIQGFVPGAAATSRARRARQTPAYKVARAAQQSGNGGDGHALVVEEASDGLRADVQAVAADGGGAGLAQRVAQQLALAAQFGGYQVQGLFVVKVALLEDVYVDVGLLDTRSAMRWHQKALPQPAAVSKAERRHYKGLVYNLTVAEDESYYVEGFAAHNCTCQMVALPKGAGFDEHGRMAMGGAFGVLTDAATLEERMAQKSMLQKAMAKNAREVVAFGLPLGRVRWAKGAAAAHWLAQGQVLHKALTVPALVGPVGTATDVYIVHGQRGPDSVALGFKRPLDAALAYQSAQPQAGVASMEVISLKSFCAYLEKAEGKALRKAASPGQRIAAEDVRAKTDWGINPAAAGHGQNLVLRLPGKAKGPNPGQDVGGVRARMHNPQQGTERPTYRVDRKGLDIYAGDPVFTAPKPDVAGAPLGEDALKLVIARNKKNLKSRLAAAAERKKAASQAAGSARVFRGFKKAITGMERPGHKYISRKQVNGNWEYTYADEGGMQAARAPGGTTTTGKKIFDSKHAKDAAYAAFTPEEHAEAAAHHRLKAAGYRGRAEAVKQSGDHVEAGRLNHIAGVIEGRAGGHAKAAGQPQTPKLVIPKTPPAAAPPTKAPEPKAPEPTAAATKPKEKPKKDATPPRQTLKTVYRFASVQTRTKYGNPATQAQRNERELASAAEAMTQALGLPPQFASLNGRLSVAFEDYDPKSNAAAYYRPDEEHIHLGDLGKNSYAHEWGHALDNFLGKQMFGKGFITDWANSPSGLTAKHGAVSAAFRALVKSPEYQSHIAKTRRDSVRDKYGKPDYYNDPREVFARAFHAHLAHKVAATGRKEKILNPKAMPPRYHPKKEDLGALSARFDAFFALLGADSIINKALGVMAPLGAEGSALRKAVPGAERPGHKYISRERKGDHWDYTYAEIGGGEKGPATKAPEAAPMTPEQKQQDLTRRAAQWLMNRKAIGLKRLLVSKTLTEDVADYHLRRLCGAFLSMQDCLHLPSHMMSFNHRLTVNILATNKTGGSLATYHSRKAMITLSKAGVGSLAHEWGHFFDHTLGALLGHKTFLSEVAADSAPPNQGAPEQAMRQAFQALTQSADYKKYTDYVVADDRYKTADPKMQKYLADPAEAFARVFAGMIELKLWRTGKRDDYLVRPRTLYYQPRAEHLEPMEPLFDALFAHFAASPFLTKALLAMGMGPQNPLPKRVPVQ